jgi:hypothetical protein
MEGREYKNRLPKRKNHYSSSMLPRRTPAPHPVKPARPCPPEHPVNLAPMEGRRGKGKAGRGEVSGRGGLL